MKKKNIKIFRMPIADKYETYFISYEGLMCSGITIFEETEQHEEGLIFLEAKKIDCSYADVVEKLKTLSINCVKEGRLTFDDLGYDAYKSVFQSYREMGKVITVSGFRVLKHSNSLRTFSIVETYMPKKDFYHVVKNNEVLSSSNCLRNEKFCQFFDDYLKVID